MMKIDLMLADYATVHEGKLFISGAGIDTLHASPEPKPYTVRFAVALTMKIPMAQTAKDHELVISITDSAGKNVVLRTSGPHDTSATDRERITAKFNLQPHKPTNSEDEFTIPLAFLLYGLTLPREGIYTLRAVIDGAVESSARFRVIAPRPIHPMTATGRIEATNCDTGIKFSGSGAWNLPDLKMISRGNRVGIDVGDDVEVHDYGTVIE